MSKYVCILILFITISCKKPKEKLIVLLNTEIESQINKKLIDVDLFIASDSDCMSCYYEYLQSKTKNIKTIGVYKSSYPIAFEKRLKKVDSNIDWRSILNEGIINALIEKSNKSHGPFFIKIRSGEIESIL